MKKIIYPVLSLLILSSTNACNQNIDLNNDLLSQSQVNFSSTKRQVKLSTNKSGKNETVILNKLTEKFNLKNSSKNLRPAKFDVSFEVGSNSNSSKGHVSVLNAGLNSMHKASSYKSGYEIARRSIKSVYDDLDNNNDPDWGMKNLLKISDSIEGSMYHETWFKVYAKAMKHVIQNGYNDSGTSVNEPAILEASLDMMYQGRTYQERCYIGRSALRVFKEHPKYGFVANSALSAAGDGVHWEDWYYVIENTLKEMSRF